MSEPDNKFMASRSEKLGIAFTDTIIESAHLTYNAPRGRKMVLACLNRLRSRIDEIQPKKALPKYKKAQYG